MNIKTNSIVNKTDTGGVNAVYGTKVSTGVHNVQGNINISGVTTVGFLTANNANISGVITATSFVGDGSQLQGVPTVSSAKSIALRYIFGDLPYRG